MHSLYICVMALWYFHLLLLLSIIVFTLQNKCKIAIWPGILAGAGKPLLMDGGFQLRPDQAINIKAPQGWSGRFWAPTRCSFDASGLGKCMTGDCGGVLKCGGAGGQPPASLAEFTLDSPIDFYDVSLVDGHNIPISIAPYGRSSRGCKAISSVSYVNRICPASLQVKWRGHVVACKSACLAFGQPQFCCSEQCGNPSTCKPSYYSNLFKAACPSAYSYAYDDPTSTFTYNGANYLIKFC